MNRTRLARLAALLLIAVPLALRPAAAQPSRTGTAVNPFALRRLQVERGLRASQLTVVRGDSIQAVSPQAPVRLHAGELLVAKTDTAAAVQPAPAERAG